MKRLSVTEQRRLVGALPAHRMALLKKHCRACEMRGEGFTDILKSAGKTLGAVAKEIGPTVLKELILPLLKEKYINKKGKGLVPAGSGLKLAGQGKKKRKCKSKK